MKRGGAVFCLLCGLFFGGRPAWSLGLTTFGAEFTFFEPYSSGNGGWEKVPERMQKHLVEGQPEGAKFRMQGADFTSPNGWSFSVGVDPGVVEIRTAPATVEVWKRFKDDMQDAIFVSAANVGFFPAMFQGGGHINLGTSAFEGNNLLLRNFVVDLINHDELFMGVFNYDYQNATPFQLIMEERQKEVYELIERFDKGEFENSVGQVHFLQSLHKAIARNKHIAFCFDDVGMGPGSRIEIRGVRPQASMDVWIRQIDLIYHRLLYLEKFKEPIPIAWKVPLHEIKMMEPERHDLNPPVDPQEALKAFYEYVTESGLNWRDHTDYLWPRWVTGGELAKFEESEWFKSREEKRSPCEIALSS